MIAAHKNSDESADNRRRVERIRALGNDPEFIKRLREAIEFFKERGVLR